MGSSLWMQALRGWNCGGRGKGRRAQAGRVDALPDAAVIVATTLWWRVAPTGEMLEVIAVLRCLPKSPVETAENAACRRMCLDFVQGMNLETFENTVIPDRRIRK